MEVRPEWPYSYVPSLIAHRCAVLLSVLDRNRPPIIHEKEAAVDPPEKSLRGPSWRWLRPSVSAAVAKTFSGRRAETGLFAAMCAYVRVSAKGKGFFLGPLTADLHRTSLL